MKDKNGLSDADQETADQIRKVYGESVYLEYVRSKRGGTPEEQEDPHLICWYCDAPSALRHPIEIDRQRSQETYDVQACNKCKNRYVVASSKGELPGEIRSGILELQRTETKFSLGWVHRIAAAAQKLAATGDPRVVPYLVDISFYDFNSWDLNGTLRDMVGSIVVQIPGNLAAHLMMDIASNDVKDLHRRPPRRAIVVVRMLSHAKNAGVRDTLKNLLSEAIAKKLPSGLYQTDEQRGRGQLVAALGRSIAVLGGDAINKNGYCDACGGPLIESGRAVYDVLTYKVSYVCKNCSSATQAFARR